MRKESIKTPNLVIDHSDARGVLDDDCSVQYDDEDLTKIEGLADDSQQDITPRLANHLHFGPINKTKRDLVGAVKHMSQTHSRKNSTNFFNNRNDVGDFMSKPSNKLFAT